MSNPARERILGHVHEGDADRIRRYAFFPQHLGDAFGDTALLLGGAAFQQGNFDMRHNQSS